MGLELDVAGVVDFMNRNGFPAKEEWIRSRKRNRDQVLFRFAFMYILKCTTTLTLKGIGKVLGRDHSTVIHALQDVENWRITFPEGWRVVNEALNYYTHMPILKDYEGIPIKDRIAMLHHKIDRKAEVVRAQGVDLAALKAQLKQLEDEVTERNPGDETREDRGGHNAPPDPT